MTRFVSLACVLLPVLVARGAAQTSAPDGAGLFGTWQFDLKQGEKSGPRTVIVRPDSSASYGKETVRWRVKPDSLLLALGGEWVSYRLKLRGKQLELSGGDLNEPITFNRVGPATPRPDSIPVPPDPDHSPS
ncbi:MAG TPA: hypothetical protein VK688_04305 [Gemmatimonadales bacterium]|jgi:hypothetical protein|nr:hypothetical protein [Gemmatimonadales bacterium]